MKTYTIIPEIMMYSARKHTMDNNISCVFLKYDDLSADILTEIEAKTFVDASDISSSYCIISDEDPSALYAAIASKCHIKNVELLNSDDPRWDDIHEDDWAEPTEEDMKDLLSGKGIPFKAFFDTDDCI